MSHRTFPITVGFVGENCRHPEVPHKLTWGRLYAEPAGLVFHNEPTVYNNFLAVSNLHMVIPWTEMEKTWINKGYTSLVGSLNENVSIQYRDTMYDMLATVCFMPAAIVRFGSLARAREFEAGIWATRAEYLRGTGGAMTIHRR
jgi:hypothetical protein